MVELVHGIVEVMGDVGGSNPVAVGRSHIGGDP